MDLPENRSDVNLKVSGSIWVTVDNFVYAFSVKQKGHSVIIKSGRINWNFLAVFAICAAALVLTIGGLWFWNKHLRAQRGLRLGLAAYENKQWEEAGKYLGQYLAAILPEQSTEVLLKYAEAQLNVRPLKRENLEQAMRAYHQILRIEENKEARKTLIELYLQTDPLEAERNAQQYLEQTFDSQIACYAARAQMMQRQFQKAFDQLRGIVQQEPSCINAYLLLAQGAEESPQQFEKKPLEWLTQAIDANPDNPLAYLYRARYFLRKDQPESAASDIERTESLVPLTREQNLQLVSVYLLADQLQKACLLLQTLQTEDSNDAVLWNLWAQWALQNGSGEEMARIAEEGLSAIQPDPYDFISIAVELFIRARHWEQAQAGIRILTDRKERQEYVSYLEGLMAEGQKDWPKAIAAWRKILASSSDHVNVQIKLAQALEQTGDSTAAIQQLRTLLLQHPEQGMAYSLLAQWYAETRRWTEALDHVRRALQIYPKDRSLQNLLIEIKMQKARAANTPFDDEESSRMIQQLQSHDPDDPTLQFLQFQISLQEGQLDEAERQLNQIQEQKENELQIRLMRADLFLARQQSREAEQLLDETIQRYSESLEPIQKRVILFVQNKEYETCLEMLKRAGDRMTSFEKQKTLRLWKAEVCILAGRNETAVKELMTLAQEDSQDIAVRRRLLELTQKTESLERLQQWIQEIRALEGEQGRQWRFEQAQFLFERGDFSKEYPQIASLLKGILRDYPDDQSSRILLARSHEAAGNLQLAITEYRDALARDPDNLDLVVAAVAAMYRAEEYRQAEDIIERISRRGLRDPRLSRLEAQQLLKQGKLGSASEILSDMLTRSPEDQKVKLSLALIRLYQNRLEEAEQLIEELLENKPDSLPAIAAKVELALRRGDPHQAIQICDQAAAQFNNPNIYMLRAITRTKIGDSQKAEEDLWKMLELTGSSKESLLLTGDLFLRMGKPKLASKVMDQALLQAPDEFLVLKKAALVYAQDPLKRQIAAEVLKKSLVIQENDPDLRLLKARFLLNENTAESIEAAETMLERLVFEFPHLESAWVTMADWYYQEGQTGRAMDHVLRGLGFFPDSKALLLLKAQIEGMRSEYLAIPTLKNLHERFPQDQRITAILIEFYIRNGQVNEAFAFLQELGADADNAPVIFQQLLMMVLYEKGEIQQTKQLFEKLEMEGKDPSGTLSRWVHLLIRDKKWSDLGDLCKRKGMDSPDLLPLIAEVCLQIGMEEDPDGREIAQASLSYLITNHPNNPNLYLSLGRLYHYWQQYTPAEQTYRKILTLDVPVENSVRVIAMNNLAWILFHESQDLEEALQMANKGLTIQPDNADLLDTRGEIYLITGRYENAKKDLEHSLKIYPPNSSKRVGSGYRLAKTLIKLGKNNDAAELFRQVEQWNRRHSVLSAEQLNEVQTFIKN